MNKPLTRRAEADLEEIAAYVAAQSPRAAVRLLSRLRALCRSISEAPLSHKACEDIRPGLRRAVLRPYIIFFTVDQDGVCIERIVHGARDLPQIFKPAG